MKTQPWTEKSKKIIKKIFIVSNKKKKLVFLYYTYIAKTQALSTIRILGRDPVGSDPLFTKEV